MLVLGLSVDPQGDVAHRIDQALAAAGQLERALVRWGLANLDQMRYSNEWQRARTLPTGVNTKGEIIDQAARQLRNAALGACRQRFTLTGYAFTAKVLELRRESRWICEHVPSSSALSHAAVVFESFAVHIFRQAGRPRWHHPNANNVLVGYSRDRGRGMATDAEIAAATAKNKQPPQPRAGSWPGLSLQGTYPEGLSTCIRRVTRNGTSPSRSGSIVVCTTRTIRARSTT